MSAAESMLERYKRAVFEKDVEAFTGLFDPGIMVFDMWGQWTHEGIGEWRKMAEDWFSSLGEERVRVSYEQVREHSGGGILAVTALLKFTALGKAGEELRSLQNRLTWVISSGKIVHEHTSAPIDHSTLKAKLFR